MARQRVQVQNIQAPTEVRPTARVVETYVKPAAPEFRPSALSQFIEGISPAIQTISQIEKEKEVKRQIEIEKGEKKKKAAEARLILSRATRAAKSAGNEALVVDPDKYYGEGGEEALTEVRREAVADIFAEIKDEEILEAVEADFKLANIEWFEKNFDPEKNKHLRGKTLGNVFNEVIAIEEDDTMTMAEKEQEIEALFQQTVDTYENISFAHVNQFAVGTLQRRTREFGKGALYNVLDKRNQFNAGNFLEAGIKIDGDNESYQDEKKPEVISSAIEQMIAIEKATNRSAAEKQAAFQDIITSTTQNNSFVSEDDIYFAMANVAQERMFEKTTTPMYEFLKSKPEAMNNPNMASNFDNINRIISQTEANQKREREAAQAKLDKEKLEAADDLTKRTAITTSVISFRQGAFVSEMIGKEVVLPSGKSYTITKDDAITEFERQSQIALQEKLQLAEQEETISGETYNEAAIAQRHLAEDMENFYNKIGAVPRVLADPINTNVSLLTSVPLSGVNDEQTLAKAEEVLTAYTAMRAMGADVKNTNVTDNDTYRLKALDFFKNTMGMDMATALSKVQGKKIDATVGNVDVEELTKDGFIFSRSEFRDIRNNGHVREYIKRGAEYLMALEGMTREKALELMSQEAELDFVVVKDKNGVKTALEKLSGDMRLAGTSPETIQNFVNAVAEIPDVQDVINRIEPNGAISLANDYDNPQVLTLVINDEDGAMTTALASIDMATLQGTTMEIIVENALREINKQLPTLNIGNVVGSIEEGLVGKTGLTPEQFKRMYPYSRIVEQDAAEVVNDVVSNEEKTTFRKRGRK
jgi:hypothetical protein